MKNAVLDYIRRNLTHDKILKVESILTERWDVNLLDPKQYFSYVLMESVYRAHKGSYKVDASKSRGLAYMQLILYLLFGEPKPSSIYDLGEENKVKIRKTLRKRLGSNIPFARFCLRYLDVKTGERVKGTTWINVEPYIYPLLGGEIFFYCTLIALIKVGKRALTDEEYNMTSLATWEEAVVHYLIGQFISR